MSDAMLVPMLKSIRQMLIREKAMDMTAKDVEMASSIMAYMAKVECAQEVLGELIQHLEGEQEPIDGEYDEKGNYTDYTLDKEAEQAKRELLG